MLGFFLFQAIPVYVVWFYKLNSMDNLKKIYMKLQIISPKGLWFMYALYI